MFESLTQRLERAFKNIRGQGRLTEKNMKDSLEEIRLALLEADVNYKVVKDFIADVQEAAAGQKVLDSVQPGQQIFGVANRGAAVVIGQKAHMPAFLFTADSVPAEAGAASDNPA